ncbi:hypothetical protein OZK63_43160, partial [Streptomyces sp. UMAF16]|nr:hypothetical protein [Streptomyces sp. UMAF16]
SVYSTSVSDFATPSSVKTAYDEASKKEPAITDKKSGFNLEKTSSIENNSNKLFTAAGAYNLNNKKWDIH